MYARKKNRALVEGFFERVVGVTCVYCLSSQYLLTVLDDPPPHSSPGFVAAEHNELQAEADRWPKAVALVLLFPAQHAEPPCKVRGKGLFSHQNAVEMCH